MAELTVYFKNQKMKTYQFETGMIRIGRDERNDIVIDSLDVAPAHAIMRIRKNDCAIRRLHDDFPLIINDRAIDGCYLTNEDRITLGRFHSIVYNTSDEDYEIPRLKPETLEEIENLAAAQQIANLQIISGPDIGKIVPVRKQMTRLGLGGNGVVVISKRKEGYFISALEAHTGITINKIPLNEETVKLNNGDVIVVDKHIAKFFLD